MGKSYASRPDDWPIAVFVTAGAPRSAVDLGRVGRPPGKRIGRFEVRGGPGLPWRTAVSKAKGEARDLGGDAVLINGGDEYYRVLRGYVYRRVP